MAVLPVFRRHAIYQGEPSERVLCVVGDINGDGVPEIVIGARAPVAELYWLGRSASGEWVSHLMDSGFETLEAGGALYDVNGNGRLDLVAGHDARGNKLLWWENLPDPAQPWPRHEIATMPAHKTHDQMIAHLLPDTRAELYYWNQRAQTLFCAPLPDAPTVTPWPGIHPVVTDVAEEGLCAADVDGDGRLELVAGQSWYKPLGGERWARHVFAEGWVTPKSVAADFDGDGWPEIVLAEGDASLNRRPYGRVGLFKAGDDPGVMWHLTILHERLLDPHSLAVADFDGDGQPDLFVGEMGMPDGNHPHPPAQRIYVNHGGELIEQVIDTGLGTHESKAIVLDGRVGIVAKPFRVLRSSAPRTPDVDTIYLWLPE